MLALDPNVALGRQDLMTYLDLCNIASRNVVLDPAGTAIGVGSTAKVLLTNTIGYTVGAVSGAALGGIFKSKTTAEVAFTATTMNIPANAASIQEACYYMCVNAAGTLSIVMGAIATGAGNAQWPERSAVADGLAIWGGVRIAVAAAAPGSTHDFVAGTTALSDGRLSAVTYYDFGYIAPAFSAAM
jgi:hypothetical protein